MNAAQHAAEAENQLRLADSLIADDWAFDPRTAVLFALTNAVLAIAYELGVPPSGEAGTPQAAPAVNPASPPAGT